MSTSNIIYYYFQKSSLAENEPSEVFQNLGVSQSLSARFFFSIGVGGEGRFATDLVCIKGEEKLKFHVSKTRLDFGEYLLRSLFKPSLRSRVCESVFIPLEGLSCQGLAPRVRAVGLEDGTEGALSSRRLQRPAGIAATSPRALTGCTGWWCCSRRSTPWTRKTA